MKRLLLVGVLLGTWGGEAFGETFQICARVAIMTTDSALTANGIAEDKWLGANNPSGYPIIARGFRVRVRQGSWAETFDSDPATGCFAIARDSAQGFDVRVYGFATDSAGNHVRIHDGGLDSSSWYPGSTYSTLWTNQTLSSAQPNVYMLDGVGDPRYTAIASAAYGLYRFHDGNAGTTVSIGFDFSQKATCNSSGSIFGSSTSYIVSNRAHLIRIGHCWSTATDAREKMLVTHELGHTMLRLYYGRNGDDAPRSQTYPPPASITTADPPQGSDCINVSSYDMNSLEWNSQAFKEAFADFYSAKVWNVKAARGTYAYRSVAYDLEKWDNVGDTNTEGGFSGNWCGSTADGVTTKGDMLRFLWDFYTVSGCASQPNRLDMMDVYRKVRENHLDNTKPLTIFTYDEGLKYAIENSVPSLSGCEQLGYTAYASWNGVR